MVFWMELELISCVFLDSFCVTLVNMEQMSRGFTLFVLCCAVFFFFLVQVSLDGSTISSLTKDPMSSDVWGLLYKSVASSWYLSSNFWLSTHSCVIWLYTGFLGHLVLLGSVGITLILIAFQFLCLFQVSTLWCDLFLVGDDSLQEDLD